MSDETEYLTDERLSQEVDKRRRKAEPGPLATCLGLGSSPDLDMERRIKNLEDRVRILEEGMITEAPKADDTFSVPEELSMTPVVNVPSPRLKLLQK